MNLILGKLRKMAKQEILNCALSTVSHDRLLKKRWSNFLSNSKIVAQRLSKRNIDIFELRIIPSNQNFDYVV